MTLCPVRDHARGDSQERGVERQKTTYVGEHGHFTATISFFGVSALVGVGVAVGISWTFRRRGKSEGLIIGEEEHRFGCNDATHGMADQDSMDRRIDGRGGGRMCDFEIDHLVLQPATKDRVSMSRPKASHLDYFVFFHSRAESPSSSCDC